MDITTSLERVDQILRILTVEVPADMVDAARREAIGEVRKKAEVKGFRKGKVPDQILQTKFSAEIETETVEEIVRESYPAAVERAGVHPLNDPKIEMQGKIEKGKPLTYKARFEVYPDFTAEGYEGLALEREPSSVSDEEIEAELGRLRHERTQLEPASEGELGPGMVAMIDFKGTAGGAPFEGSEAEDYVVDFGAGNLLEGFESGIQGMKASEEREIAFDYPADYFKPEIAGKRGAFKVRLKEIRRKIVPELDDDFAKDLGTFKDLGEVRAELGKRMAVFKERAARHALREQVIRQLIEKHRALEAPSALVSAELGNMLDQLERHLKAGGRSLADQRMDAKEFVKANLAAATDRARGYMIVSAVAKQEKIDATEEDVAKRIEEIAEMGKEPTAKVREQFEEKGLMNNLRGQIQFEKTLDFVIGKAKISQKEAKKDK